MRGFIRLNSQAEIEWFMNENAFLIIACLSAAAAMVVRLILPSKKVAPFFVLSILATPSLIYSPKQPLVLCSTVCAVAAFLIFKYHENNTQAQENSNLNISEARNRFKKEKMEFEKTIEEEKRFSSLYVIIKTLSETFKLKNAASILKEKISIYLDAREVSMFLVKDDKIERLFGEHNLKDVLQECESFEKQDFVHKDGKYYYAFRDNQSVFFFFSVVCTDTPEKMKEKFEDLSLEIFPAIKRISLFAKIDELSVIDGLTGVYRRGFFDEKLNFEFSRAMVFKTSLALMILDIDHFKKINDTYGHQAGDTILKKVAAIIKDNVYETDIVARYGGEEFVVIMPRAQAEGALRKAEYIRKLIDNETFEVGVEKIKVTISAGIAHYPQDANAVSDLINKADLALYKAKEAGRNRIYQWQQ